MKSKNDTLKRIRSSMEAIGIGRAADIICEEMGNADKNEGDLQVIADSLNIYEEEVKSEKEKRLFDNSNLDERIYFSDFWDYKVRMVDRQLLAEDCSMEFIDVPHKNVVIWGPYLQ